MLKEEKHKEEVESSYRSYQLTFAPQLPAESALKVTELASKVKGAAESANNIMPFKGQSSQIFKFWFCIPFSRGIL